ncbi:MAG: hypothetical protein ABSA33_05400 [Candidatus Micrarchaeaceae archaeon]
MFNFNKQPQVIQVSVEYRAPHFMVLVKNPGQKQWEPVRSTTRKVRVQDEFGIEVKSYPAIEAFPTQAAAEHWIAENLPKHERKHRSKSELKALNSWARAESPEEELAYQYTSA